MNDLIERYSYVGLFIILLIEEGGIPIPIPGDLFIATLSAFPHSSYFLVIATVVLSTLIGSTILFTLAKKLGHRFIIRYGKYIRLTPERIKRVERWFDKYGAWAIIIGRLIPGFRTITPVVAGLFGFSYKKFWLATAIAAFVWANIYFIIGKFLGEIFKFNG